jgi:hypothetical protein
MMRRPTADEPGLFIAIYTDEDITSKLAPALRERGFDALSAVEASMLNATDADQLAYAASRRMAVLTCDAVHFVGLAKQFAAAGQSHAGIILSSEQYGRRHFGELLRTVLRLLNSLIPDQMRGGVVYLEQFR